MQLQKSHDCFFFVADWHALTTQFRDSGDRGNIERNVYDMVVDWLAAGIDPEQATLFIQSRMPEHAELFTLLAMSTPSSWLERIPSYKDQIEKNRELATYGFLGYPLLQAADILIYKAAFVPVGEDQAAHVEVTREVARRFNRIYSPEQTILPEPQELLTDTARLTGLDGPKNEQEQWQCDRHARRAGRRRGKNPHHADRPAAGAPHRCRRPGPLPGLAAASGLLQPGCAELGRAGLPIGRHRLPGLQAAADRSDSARTSALARARQ